MSGNFDRKLRLPRIHFRVLLHPANMRHGTNGFTSLPKGGVLRIFSASAGFEPANLGTKGQYATSRPPKSHEDTACNFTYVALLLKSQHPVNRGSQFSGRLSNAVHENESRTICCIRGNSFAALGSILRKFSTADRQRDPRGGGGGNCCLWNFSISRQKQNTITFMLYYKVERVLHFGYTRE